MKKSFQLKNLLVSMAMASSVAFSMTSVTAHAGVSANIGMVSNYVFRGVEQTDSASGFAGLDYENDSGFYAGTWIADVTDGLEYDLYAGWSGEMDGISLGVGGTYYGYTERAFDEPYKEVNLSVGFAGVTLGYDKGIHELAKEEDYSNAYISYEYNSFSATYGVYDANIDVKKNAVSYLDLGYSTELSPGLEGGVNYIYASPEDSNNDPKAYLILGISKSFDVM